MNPQKYRIGDEVLHSYHHFSSIKIFRKKKILWRIFGTSMDTSCHVINLWKRNEINRFTLSHLICLVNQVWVNGVNSECDGQFHFKVTQHRNKILAPCHAFESLPILVSQIPYNEWSSNAFIFRKNSSLANTQMISNTQNIVHELIVRVSVAFIFFSSFTFCSSLIPFDRTMCDVTWFG